jgi:hypothetical protein
MEVKNFQPSSLAKKHKFRLYNSKGPIFNCELQGKAEII